jgi:DNA-binding NarL/FixJ family response regulator
LCAYSHREPGRTIIPEIRWLSLGDAVLNADTPKSLKILVVDDFELFRKQVCALLESQPGFEVICEAANGLEAVRHAEELQPDIVVLDITMPALGGLEAAVLIRKVAPKAAIVFLSQHNSRAIARTALDTGALGYVVKSAAMDDLVAAVKAAAEGKIFVSKVE